MAGHSHWAGIKHRKGRADKQKSKIFSKISREITVAAKLGSKDPAMNNRLRSAIHSAKNANMPKENIKRAISKSEIQESSNYENLRYEGFGPKKIAVIVEGLTDNKNRTASNIRTIFQKFGGNLGENGAASHHFKQVGVIRINKEKIPETNILELAIDAGAEDCNITETYYEIITKKEELYKVKIALEKHILEFISSEIEWQAINKIVLNGEESKNFITFLEELEDNDDVQNVYTNFQTEMNNSIK